MCSMVYARLLSTLQAFGLSLLLVFTVSGCIFVGDAGQQPSADADPDADAGDTEDVPDDDTADDTVDDTADDSADPINCPDDCQLTVEYTVEADNFEPLDQGELTLFEPVGIRANPQANDGSDLTGCTVEWTVQSPDERPRAVTENATNGTQLLPVALAPDPVEVNALATCDQGEIDAKGSFRITYPEAIPTAGDGGPPVVHWWSARSAESYELEQSPDPSVRWHTVDPAQSIFMSVNEPDNAPSLTGAGERDAALTFGEGDFLARRDANSAEHGSSTSAITMMLVLALDAPVPDNAFFPLVESCAGTNDQFRLRELGENDEIQTIWNGTPYSTVLDEGITTSRWLTVAMSFDNGTIRVFLNGDEQTEAPIAVDGAAPVWAWDTILDGCKTSSSSVTAELGDAIFVETSMSPTAISDLSKTLRARFEAP
jgi:hypothetical protein